MELPLVSVIIPTYNYAHYILDAINSLKQQSYSWDKIEVVVVDDGSTDNTEELLNVLQSDGELIYIRQNNQGKACATKKAISVCTGKYIFNLDADDYFLHDKIKNFVEIFELNSDVVHVASSANLIDNKEQSMGIEDIPFKITDKIISGVELLKYFYENNILFGGGSTYAARTSILQSINIPLEVDMYIDEFLLLAVLPYGKSFIFKNPLSVWRVHSSNYSSPRSSDQKKIIEKSIRAIQSSDAMLSYLKNNHFDEIIIKIYMLKNITQKLVYKEAKETKNIKDIMRYIFQIVSEIGIHPKWFVRYYILNRLLPSPIFKLLRKYKNIS
ncbi:glycosyltransferase family 2 protein [Spirosoma agri]|uniref:Glycosyltransferase family 2 protein n=1 Tax=Spirosoma agri TaxID=1987381 RepID=A0A6M0IGM6_9BACT|nr:glycosyltransferase family 2 protein [Spirosoma agri]NEU67440.1 glycosyltransferase family 2 protein [Spirosoma agri]